MMKINNIKTLVFLLLIVIFGFACASPTGIRVSSNPSGADVFWQRPGQAPQSLGKTPVTLDASEIPTLYAEPVELHFSKTGFESENVILPRTSVPSHGEINLSLKDVSSAACSQQDKALTAMARGIAETMSLIHKKNYIQAQQGAEALVNEFPNVSVPYDLLGNIYYLSKNISKALWAYQRSNDLNPGSPETQRMIQKLTLINGVQPAEGGTP